MITITYIVAGAIVLLFGAASLYLVPWLKAKLGAEKLATIIQWVRLLVRAAEQMFGADGIGAEKRRWVEKQLAARGILLNTDEIRTIIESQVKELRIETTMEEQVTINVNGAFEADTSDSEESTT